ncbi:MAG: hypothetical protein E7244_14335 [Enterocloster citroniae]|nr:hypothetical protein [Enterocloster citroniae]
MTNFAFRIILQVDGGWRMADGGWRMADGGWRMTLCCMELRCMELCCMELRCMELCCMELRCMELCCMELCCMGLHCMTGVASVTVTAGRNRPICNWRYYRRV